MPFTPVRDIELIEVGSLGKETLSNDSFTNLSLGISGAAIIPLAATDVTLTEGTNGQAQHFVLILTGTLTANVNVIVPAESRVYVADNRTTGAFTVTFRPAAGGGVAVDQSARTLIYCDGTTVYPVASGTGGGGGGSGAPTDASYLVSSAHALLSGERVVTDTATVTWDLATTGQAKAIIPADAVSYTHIQNVSSSRILGRFTGGAGDVEEITLGTGLTLDAGTGVLSATGGGGGQPLDATLTALAGLATGANLLPYFTGVDTVTTTTLSAFVRTILDDADAATVRGTISAQASDATLTALAGLTTGADLLPYFTGTDTASTTLFSALARNLINDTTQAAMQGTIGVVVGTQVQPADATLTALAGLTTGANLLPYFTGVDTATTTTLSAFIRGLLDDADAATARGTLGLGTMAQQDASAVAITGGTAGSLALQSTTGHTGIGMPLEANARLSIAHDKTTSDAIRILPTGTDTPGGSAITFLSMAGANAGYISNTATTTSYSTSSDGRLKEQVEPLPDALATVMRLGPVRFRWKVDGSLGHGLIAQEVQTVIPEVVQGTEDGELPLGLDYSKLVPWLIGCCQELAARVEALEGGSRGERRCHC